MVKAAKSLGGVIKRGGKGAAEAEKLLGLIKKADSDLGGSVQGASQQPGKAVDLIGGDGATRTKIELPGTYKGKQGHFEWIIEPSREISHRLFVVKR